MRAAHASEAVKESMDDTEVVPPVPQTLRFAEYWRVGLRPDRLGHDSFTASQELRVSADTFSHVLFSKTRNTATPDRPTGTRTALNCQQDVNVPSFFRKTGRVAPARPALALNLLIQSGADLNWFGMRGTL